MMGYAYAILFLTNLLIKTDFFNIKDHKSFMGHNIEG